ncbi:Aliphatic amidase expression-regulating protein [Grimontia celer]|uniref:Aliphatic amidase expression-regulating protein n=1 Tax=Grimontia celer TaxID=1796497 RepID=A0A128F4D1_9GAMM|nr:substrate-binding domain-containing protein [Grimontia celer]CZF81637.1 Aliphatic amidase expression-regulating protein [Grimontia celer]
MKRREFLTSSMSAALLAAISPTFVSTRALAAETVKLGVMIPQSGPAGLFGPSCKNCTEMAVEEINKSGGILGKQVEVFYADAGGSPSEALKNAVRLYKGEKVDAFIGMHDSAVRGALTNLFKGEVPYIYTPIYEGGECAEGTYVLGETPAQQLAPVIPWLAKNNKVSKWYLIGNDYNWPRDSNAAAKDYIKAAGGDVVGEEYLPFSADNFDSSLAKIKASGADAVLITLVGGASVSFNRAFANFGLDKQALRLGTLIEENTLAGIGAENAARLYSSSGYFQNINSPKAAAFAERYYEKFGSDAPALNALGESCYDGVYLFKALANEAKGVAAEKIASASEGASFSSPRGNMTLTKGHVDKDIYLAEAVDGRFRVVETFENVPSGSTCS